MRWLRRYVAGRREIGEAVLTGLEAADGQVGARAAKQDWGAGMSTIDTSPAALRKLALQFKNGIQAHSTDVVLVLEELAAEKEEIEGIQSEFAPEKFGGFADSLYAMSAEMRKLRAELVKKEMVPVYRAFAEKEAMERQAPVAKVVCRVNWSYGRKYIVEWLGDAEEGALLFTGPQPAPPQDVEGLAHEMWAAAQLAPGEGVEDGAGRLVKILRKEMPAPMAQVVPEGWKLVRTPVTEEMHVAAVKVLHRASGVEGLPQRMLDAMLAAAPQAPDAPAQDEAPVFHLRSYGDVTEQQLAEYVAQVAQATEAPQPKAIPTMADGIGAGDGTLHGAIDYWQKRALAAEDRLRFELSELKGVHATNNILANRYLEMTCGGQQAPQRVPLSDDVIDAITTLPRDALMNHIREHGTAAEGQQKFIRKIARAIERMHRITGAQGDGGGNG